MGMGWKRKRCLCITETQEGHSLSQRIDSIVQETCCKPGTVVELQLSFPTGPWQPRRPKNILNYSTHTLCIRIWTLCEIWNRLLLLPLWASQLSLPFFFVLHWHFAIFFKLIHWYQFLVFLNFSKKTFFIALAHHLLAKMQPMQGLSEDMLGFSLCIESSSKQGCTSIGRVDTGLTCGTDPAICWHMTRSCFP